MKCRYLAMHGEHNGRGFEILLNLVCVTLNDSHSNIAN